MKKKRILVIEDEKDVLENMKTLLEEEKYSVICANGGREGIALAKATLPDLIICDIMMPEVDGYEVLKVLSNDNEFNKIPFIFLTAKVEREDIRKGMQLGADDYLFKPYKADELITAIETRLRKIRILGSNSKTKNDSTIKKYNYTDKLFVKIDTQPCILKIKEILFISAENQYTLINLINGKSFLLRKSITNWEKSLPEKEFIRIHRSTIINMEFVAKVERGYNSSLMLYLEGIEKPFIISKRNSLKLKRDGF